jgi:hypothetical protein
MESQLEDKWTSLDLDMTPGTKAAMCEHEHKTTTQGQQRDGKNLGPS